MAVKQSQLPRLLSSVHKLITGYQVSGGQVPLEPFTVLLGFVSNLLKQCKKETVEGELTYYIN